MNLNKKNIIEIIILGIIISFPLIAHLDSLPIRQWDESLFGLRALYMAEYHGFMPNFNVFDNMFNHINTKLPFTTFFQALSFKLFGFSELSLRLPITMIIIAMIVTIMSWLKKIENNKYLGYIFSIILVSNSGWIMNHVARSGDQDAAFASYIILALFSFFFYIELPAKSKKRLFLGLFTFFIIAALLTKNILTFAFFPALLFYVILRKKLVSILSKPDLYISGIVVLFFFLGTIFYLDFQYPGLIKRMWNYELLGRYSKTIEGHRGGFTYYFDLWINDHFVPWIYFLPLSWSIIFRKTDNDLLKKLSLFLNISLLFIFIFLSFSKTKTPWYGASMIPVLSILTAIGIYDFSKYFITHFKEHTILKHLLFYGIGLLFLIPYINIVKKVTGSSYLAKIEKLGIVLKRAEKQFPDIKTITMADKKLSQHSGFYSEVYNRTKGYNLNVKGNPSYYPNEYVIFCGNEVFDPIKKDYKYDIIFKEDICYFIKITGKK